MPAPLRAGSTDAAVHCVSGNDLLEFMLSSYSQRVLVRSSRNRGGLLGKRVSP